MAKFQKKKIQDTENSGFGQYQEGVGGGASPKAKDPQQRGPGVNSEHRKEHNDTMQPRTDDGKFTYKSVNGQSIDPKYGPSRGKTVNPLLTGGENGVKINDYYDKQGNLQEGVESQFRNQSGAYWNKYKDKWYQKGGEAALLSQGEHHKEKWSTRVAGEAIWNVAKRRYDTVKGEFEKESKVFEEGKKGAPTQEEKAAQQKAQATGEEQFVIDQKSGGIKVKPGTQLSPLPQPTPQPSPTQKPSPVAPGQGQQQPVQQPTVNATSVSDIENADYTPKYSDDDIAAARDALQEAGFSDDELAKFDALSPKQKDDYIDENFGVDEEEEETESQPAPQQQPSQEENKTESQEEETDAEKKVKKMGFSE